MSPSDIALLQRWTDHHDAEAFHQIVTRYAYQANASAYTLYSSGRDMLYDGAHSDRWKEDGGDFILHRP